MNETSLKPARTVAELASARQHQGGGNWPAIMKRAAVEVEEGIRDLFGIL